MIGMWAGKPRGRTPCEELSIWGDGDHGRQAERRGHGVYGTRVGVGTWMSLSDSVGVRTRRADNEKGRKGRRYWECGAEDGRACMGLASGG